MRNYNDASYKKFRNEVRNRDGRKCRWPNCGARKKLQVHHIVPWTFAPYLRYEITNGITLCKKHHKGITGQELAYVQFFLGLLNENIN